MNIGLKLIAGGWSFFIAENLILSHNRERIVELLNGEKNYWYLYSTLSTASCISIGVGFFRYGLNKGPLLPWAGNKYIQMMALPIQAASLFILSQSGPTVDLAKGLAGGCPLTFAHKKKEFVPSDPNSTDSMNLEQSMERDKEIEGVLRVTRHPILMAFGLFGLGSACATIRVSEFMMGFFMFSWTVIGGLHQDYRHRRSGELSEEFDNKTSMMPFMAFAQGKQD